jgi:hypothetical protein
LLIGGLLGGPDKQDRFTNSVTDFKQCEVAVDYNAGLTAALAPLFGRFGGAPLRSFPPREKREDEFFVEASAGHGATFTEVHAWVNNRSAWPARVTEDLSFRCYVSLPPEIKPEQVRVTVRSADGAVAGAPTLQAQKDGVCFAVVRFPGVPVFPGGWDSKTGRSHYRKEAALRLECTAKDAATLWPRVRHLSVQGLPGLRGEPVKAEFIPVYEGNVRLFGGLPGSGAKRKMQI